MDLQVINKRVRTASCHDFSLKLQTTLSSFTILPSETLNKLTSNTFTSNKNTMSLIFQHPFFKPAFEPSFESSFNSLFTDLTNFDRQVSTFFDKTSQSLDTSLRAPPIDVHETSKAYKVKVSLPDVSTRDLKVDFDADRNELLIQAKTQSSSSSSKDNNAKDAKKHRTLISERFAGSFERRVVFPAQAKIDDTGIKAKLVNGVLTVRLPKVVPAAIEEAPRTKAITVETEAPEEVAAEAVKPAEAIEAAKPTDSTEQKA